MKKHLNLKIHGQVQGVWFRKHTQEEAKRLGLHGFVRNENNDTVYTEVEGEGNAIDRFLSWCYEGSPQAKVDKIDIEEIDEWQNFQDFEIRI